MVVGPLKMKDMRKYIILISVAFAVLSCSKEPDSTMKDGNVVYFSPGVELSAPANATRSIIDGGEYLPLRGYSLGIESMDSFGDTDPVNTAFYHSYGCDNIKASRADYNSAWEYKYNRDARAEVYTAIALFKTLGKLRLFAIYPYSSQFRPTHDYMDAIPFTIGTTHSINYDYMYTGPVIVDPNVAADLTKTLDFKHVMTVLEFKITNTMPGSLRLRTITLEATKGGQPQDIFLMNGTYSGYDGAITSGATRQNKVEMKYDADIVYKQKKPGLSMYTSCSFIFPAIAKALTDGTTLNVAMEFEYKNDEDGVLIGRGGSFNIDLGAIVTNSLTQGLLTGYRYTYMIDIDNFIKYTDYPQVAPWINEQIGGTDVVHEIIF